MSESGLRIAILGGGVMGETLATGLLRAVQPTPRVIVVEKRLERANELRAILGVGIADAQVAVADADVIVIAVKPQDVSALLAEVGSDVPQGSLVISIAAGIRTQAIESAVDGSVNVVRAMPNTPARVGRSVTGVSAGESCSTDALALSVSLLESVGIVVVVPERLQDAVTAVSGSGPAYVFFLAEAMISAATELGLDLETAERMVHHTILGAATLLDRSDDSAATLRAKVTSPNGTTAAAIATMEELGVGEAIVSALRSAHDRSRELSGG